MKKIIISISGLAILTFIIVLFVNAGNSTKDEKKASCEVTVKCEKSLSASECTKICPGSGVCDPLKCKSMGCDQAKCKEGICDPAACKAKCPGAKSEAVNNLPSKCMAACPMRRAIK
jgi:hypothetical protein